MTELQRIKISLKVLISLGTAKNQEELGRFLGYSNKSSFSQVINGKVSLPLDFINRLCKLNPLIDKEWLRTGNGNVLKNNYDRDQHRNEDKITNIRINTDSDKTKYLPLIEAENMTAYNYGDTNLSNDYTKQFLIPAFEQADYLITIKGSSMYPNYNNGDIAACKHLPLDTFFQWNKVYVLNTKQEVVLVKRVCKSDNDNFITLVSDNKDYDAFELQISEVLSAAIVTGIIRVVE